ncbi:MAG TPA: SrfA family protein [Pseudomonas sp.]|uniref:SrfA family protein n=1 Tax=Pseudomonas sp. TaxID=306 RepID=UPI002EDAF31F
MQGALLRSGKSESFTALGESGQPVYRAALQLREAIRRKNPKLVDHLAIPQSDELGNKIDWYSSIEGDVIPWSAATEEERAPARAQLEELDAALNELSVRFLGNDPAEQQGDKAVFGKLLKRVIHFPDENFVYLVNGKPVLTFWGFEHANADRSLEPLHCLYPKPDALEFALPPATPVEPVVEPAPTVLVRKSWWRRWWWLLPLLLLLLLLLLFGLRSCVPTLAIPGLPAVDLPKVSSEQGLSGQTVSAGNGVNGPVLDGNGTSTNGAVSAAPDPEKEASVTPQATPEDKPNEPVAEPPKPAEQAQAANALTTPPTTPAQKPAQTAAPLSIPANAKNGAADFLNGHYRAGAGIQDRRTGRPLRLEYQFKDGKGEVTVRQANGVSCSGPVSAAMNNGNLSINSSAQAACGDGSTYDMPKIECGKGAQSIADCTGGYGAEKFPMSMRQMTE